MNFNTSEHLGKKYTWDHPTYPERVKRFKEVNIKRGSCLTNLSNKSILSSWTKHCLFFCFLFALYVHWLIHYNYLYKNKNSISIKLHRKFTVRYSFNVIGYHNLKYWCNSHVQTSLQLIIDSRWRSIRLKWENTWHCYKLKYVLSN